MNQDWQSFLNSRDLKPLSVVNRNWAQECTTLSPGASVCPATDYSILAVQGNDAANFLQGQTTCDIKALSEGDSTNGAICNPKGRAVSTFLLLATGSRYYLLLPKSLAVLVKKWLGKYILRSQVTIEDLSATHACFGIDQGVPTDISKLERSRGSEFPETGTDSGIGKLGSGLWLFVGPTDSAHQQWTSLVDHDGFAESTSDHWRLRCILSGIPLLCPETSEAFVPQMINLDSLGGISFKKGCYTGQEIVARMHYLGKLKRRMYLASIDSGHLPQPGEPVFVKDLDSPVGQIVNAQYLSDTGLCMLLVLQIDQADSTCLYLEKCAQETIKILELPYTFNSD